MVERSLTASPFHWLGLAAVALSALAADQLTKQIVVTQLGLGESVHVVGPFWIRHVNNPGIAFGLFSSWASAVTFLTAGAVIWMLFYFAKSGARHPILPVALGLLIGGSMGNLVVPIRIEEPRLHGVHVFRLEARSAGLVPVVARRWRQLTAPRSQQCLFPFHVHAPL